jgi:hypothetical protein
VRAREGENEGRIRTVPDEQRTDKLGRTVLEGLKEQERIS